MKFKNFNESAYYLHKLYNICDIIIDVSDSNDSDVIENILLGIPHVSKVVFKENNDGTLNVIKGEDDLKSILAFMNGSFTLYNTEILNECEGKTFEALHRKYQRAILQYRMDVIIIDASNSDEVIKKIIKRIS